MKIVSITALLLALGTAAYVVIASQPEKKIVYINNGKLIGEFKMAIELEGTLKESERMREHVLDSLANEIRLLEGSKNKDQVERMRNDYLGKRSAFAEEMRRMRQSSTEKIANQINQYVREFAEQNNYDIVLGAAGNGNIWYAREVNDITKAVTEYANQKYNGKN